MSLRVCHFITPLVSHCNIYMMILLGVYVRTINLKGWSLRKKTSGSKHISSPFVDCSSGKRRMESRAKKHLEVFVVSDSVPG
jgi:hypothetical protein